MAKKKALGKGLGSIIPTSKSPVDDIENVIAEDKDRIVSLNIGKVRPNPDQPRTHFDDKEISGLAESIQSVGIIQPIIVRKWENEYFVIAGERRLRASKKAGLKKIRAIVMEASEEENITLALIENIQRADLDPIEEAKAYRLLMNRFKMRQQDVALKVGKERATVANSVRLLNLPPEMQVSLSDSVISVGHAKILLSLSGTQQKTIFNEIIKSGMSVRAMEQLVNGRKEEKHENSKKKKKNPQVKKMEGVLESVLGTKVEIKHAGAKGRIEINYYSLDDFDRIIELLSK